MQSFSEEQIQVAKKIVKWLMAQGLTHEHSQREVLGMLKAFTVKKLWNALQHSACTDLKNLKRILHGKELLDKERNVRQD